MDPQTLVIGPAETNIELFCEGGGRLGRVINNRWLELTCRQTRCKRNGVLTVHRWDLVTGQRSTFYRPTKPDRA